MTGNVINLRIARKQKVRQARERDAEANRQKFGRTKSQKTIEADDAERAKRTLDGAQRERDTDLE